MKKRFVTVAVAAIMAATSAFAFIGCGKDESPSAPPDTFFTGALSAESYDTPNAAAQAFLENEVSGDATNAKFESYEKQADLTEEEIAELNLTEAEQADVQSAEKGIVNYSETDVQSSYVYASATENVKTIKVYVIRFNTSYKYYAPALESGDVLTKAYFDEVFDPSKYVNCTMVNDLTVVSSASAQGITMNVTVKTKYTIKYSQDAVHAVIAYTMSIMGQTQNNTMELYVDFDTADRFNGDYTVYMKDDSSAAWEQTYIDIEEIEIGSAGQIDNDYSYFIKTKSGFKLNSEKLELFLQDAAGDLGDVAGIDIGSLKATADYNVYDGKLSTATAVVSAKINADGANGTVKATTTVKYSDFGTTVISVQI